MRIKITLFLNMPDDEVDLPGYIYHRLGRAIAADQDLSMTWEETQVPNKNNNKDTNDEMCKL